MSGSARSPNMGSALYYPYIHPRNVDRLKSALIYWDRVRRIVPSAVTEGAYADGDDDDARRLADSGLLLATAPEHYKARAFERFVQHIEPHRERFTIKADEASDLASKHYGLHVEKMGDEAIDELMSMGLALRVNDWVAMNATAGAFFMLCLAATMASDMGSPLLSDDEVAASFGQSILFEPENADDASDWMIEVGITLPSATELANVSTRDFVGFAKHRVGERFRFRQSVDGIIKVVREIDDSNALADYVITNRIELHEAYAALKTSLGELRVDVVANAAKIAVPSRVGGSLAIRPLGGLAEGILASVGLTVSAVSCYASTRGKLRTARHDAPYHYLVATDAHVPRPVVQPAGARHHRT